MWPLVSYSNDTRLARLYGLVRALLVTIVTMTIVTSILTLFVWVVLHDISGLSSDDLGSITAIIESVSAMVGALFVVFDLATDAARQGRGVATALLKTCITEARGHAVGLDVVANNKRAMSLYERLGFVVVGEGTGYSYHEAPPRVFRMRRAARDE